MFEMIIPPLIKLYKTQIHFHNIVQRLTLYHSLCSLSQSLQTAVESKAFAQIPDLLVPSKSQSLHKENPFAFLSTYPLSQSTQIIDQMLQSLIAIRPHTRLKTTYTCLLYHILQCPEPFPVSLAVLQRSLRSGCRPEPQIGVLLSSAWMVKRQKLCSVVSVLKEMESIGYYPDCNVCNYVVFSLCDVGNLVEAVMVLKCMSSAGCVPDLESYGIVIDSMCKARKSLDAFDLMKEMVVKMGLNLRQGSLVKLVAALRADREIHRSVQLIELLEKENCVVGFECYEVVVEGCLECKEYILAAKAVTMMTDKGFIPYIKVRQKTVEGLTSVGAWKIACAVRQRFADLNS